MFKKEKGVKPKTESLYTLHNIPIEILDRFENDSERYKTMFAMSVVIRVCRENTFVSTYTKCLKNNPKGVFFTLDKKNEF